MPRIYNQSSINGEKLKTMQTMVWEKGEIITVISKDMYEPQTVKKLIFMIL